MKATLTSVALVALAAAMHASSASAQALRIDVSLKVPGLHARAYHVRPGHVVRHGHCERSGRYWYCWDGRPRGAQRQIVYVYDAPGRGRPIAPGHRRHREIMRQHQRAAERGYWRWHRSAYPQYRTRMDVVLVLR